MSAIPVIIRAKVRTIIERCSALCAKLRRKPVPQPERAEEPGPMIPEPEPVDPALLAEMESIQRDIAEKETLRASLEVKLAETQAQLFCYEQRGNLVMALDAYKFASPEAKRIAREALEARLAPETDPVALAAEFLRQYPFLLAPAAPLPATTWPALRDLEFKKRLFSARS